MSGKKSSAIISELRPIKYGDHPKVLLMGNGINRAFKECTSLSDLLSDTLKQNNKDVSYDEIKNLPFPLQIIVSTKDRVDDKMGEFSSKLKTSVPSPELRSFISKNVRPPFEAVLTTNYSLEIERSIIPDFKPGNAWYYYRHTNSEESTRQKNFNLFCCTELPLADPLYLWHIHGTALKKSSMIIGHYYYGKLLSEITDRAATVLREMKVAASKSGSFFPKSWIDYFLICDVNILGFGMDFSESDIWWLLEFKNLHNDELMNPKTVFFGANDLSKDKKALLKSMNCSVDESVSFDIARVYANYYQDVFSYLKN